MLIDYALTSTMYMYISVCPSFFSSDNTGTRKIEEEDIRKGERRTSY